MLARFALQFHEKPVLYLQRHRLNVILNINVKIKEPIAHFCLEFLSVNKSGADFTRFTNIAD
jgi:hypothetical protein